MASELAKKFVENFKKFADVVNEETLKAAPIVS
jgi:ATP-dependent phosphoenolpyruvate carboxykinase